MPNSYTGFFQTLAASFNEAALAKGGRNALINYVTRDFSPEVATPLSVINTNIAASTGSASHIAAGSTLSLSNVTLDPGAVTLDQHPAYGFAVPNFDTARGPSASLMAKLRDEAWKKMGNFINGYLASLLTTGNFDDYASGTPVASGADTISDTAMQSAWATLAANDVPVGDIGNFFLVTHPVVYSSLLGTSSWTQASYVSDQLSMGIRQTARLGTQWGAFADWDPDMPTTTGGSPTDTKYYSTLFHRYAIALVSRALAPPMDPGVPTTYVSYGGLPIRVTIVWNNRTMSDELVFDALFGAAVVRSDHGILLLSS
jgi:hypothetical protein